MVNIKFLDLPASARVSHLIGLHHHSTRLSTYPSPREVQHLKSDVSHNAHWGTGRGFSSIPNGKLLTRNVNHSSDFTSRPNGRQFDVTTLAAAAATYNTRASTFPLPATLLLLKLLCAATLFCFRRINALPSCSSTHSEEVVVDGRLVAFFPSNSSACLHFCRRSPATLSPLLALE